MIESGQAAHFRYQSRPVAASKVAAGIDWHKRGWVAVVLGRSSSPCVLVGADLRALIDRLDDAHRIGIDMPIGVPDVERAADSLARRYVGCRRNSVFMTPPRKALAASSYPEANVIAPTISGKKISQQAWALRKNIAVVEGVVAGNSRVIEVHPEVSFRAMAGEELTYSKATWNGQNLRRRLLEREGISLPDRLDEGGDVPAADVLDAAAAAWSALRCATGDAGSFPPGAAAGQREVIWY
jgi:predicted RNase H-like nuclease